MTRLRKVAVARSTSRARSSRTSPSAVILEWVCAWIPTILPSLTRLSKAEGEREMGLPSSHTSVNSVCPTGLDFPARSRLDVRSYQEDHRAVDHGGDG